jgi:hypothetical protein
MNIEQRAKPFVYATSQQVLLLYWLFVEDAIDLVEYKSPPLES